MDPRRSTARHQAGPGYRMPGKVASRESAERQRVPRRRLELDQYQLLRLATSPTYIYEVIHIKSYTHKKIIFYGRILVCHIYINVCDFVLWI